LALKEGRKPSSFDPKKSVPSCAKGRERGAPSGLGPEKKRRKTFRVKKESALHLRTETRGKGKSKSVQPKSTRKSTASRFAGGGQFVRASEREEGGGENPSAWCLNWYGEKKIHSDHAVVLERKEDVLFGTTMGREGRGPAGTGNNVERGKKEKEAAPTRNGKEERRGRGIGAVLGADCVLRGRGRGGEVSSPWFRQTER